MTILKYVTDSPEALVAISAPEPKQVWINGSETIVYTGADLPQAEIPGSVSAWQLRKALNATGLRSAVETAVAGSDQDTKDAWEYATEYQRSHPLVISMGAALGKSVSEIDDLFVLAASL